MSESLKSVGAITMFIDDTQRSKAFYEQVFGAKAVSEDEDAVTFGSRTWSSTCFARGRRTS
jgi:catechol 2,3-dioxygenase-like lactoylglutathione lyase family enzyme